MDTLAIIFTSALGWQLLTLLIALLLLKQIKDDIRPIFQAMVGPLTRQAQTNAIAWTIGIMLGVLSSLGALTEVAAQMHWVYVAIACKVLGPGLATIVALVKQAPTAAAAPAPVIPKPAASSATTAPFPPASNP